MLLYATSSSPQRSSKRLIAVHDCHTFALPANESLENLESMQVNDSISVDSVADLLASAQSCDPILSEEQVSNTPPSPQSPPHTPTRPAPTSPAPVSAPLPAPTPTPSRAEDSLPKGTNENCHDAPPVAGDDLMDIDDQPSATQDTSVYSTASVGQKPVNTISVSGSRMQRKRKVDHVDATEEAPSKRDSQLKRLSIQNSVEKEVCGTKNNSARSTRRTKRPSPDPSTPPSATATFWGLKYQQMFLEEDLGQEWKHLVSSWVAFEERPRSQANGHRLLATGRPKVVGHWISRARPTTWQPTIADLSDYKGEFDGWWKSLQPTWRISNNEVDKTLIQGDWDCLRIPGLNGVISVVVALFYWGLALKEKPAHREAWFTAVQDCQQVFALL